MNLHPDIHYIGVNDHKVDLFESQYKVPNGMSYNSYVIMDEKIAVMDTVGEAFGETWLANLAAALDGRKPDYLIIQHMEPDHSGDIANFAARWPEAVLVGNAKTFTILGQFFGELPNEKLTVTNGQTLSLGRHELSFIFAPMVHWPEVMFTYDAFAKTLFTADAFGKFGALDVADDWADEARRYYIGIVGKYGAQVQAVLKKAAALDVETICPLHGPVLSGDLTPYCKLYDLWSSYTPEENAVVIAYASVYGHTKAAALRLAEKLQAKGITAKTFDLARTDMALVVAEAFRCSKLVLASVTYNGEAFPVMRSFLSALTERAYQNRTVAIMENGSWAPASGKQMIAAFEKSKNVTILPETVKIKSALNAANEAELDALAAALAEA